MEKIWINIIAVLEIIGGIVGILFIVYASVVSGFAFNVMIIVPISLGIFSLSLVAGVYLWIGHEFGRKASIIIQWIQLPKISLSAITFMFSFGLDAFAHVTFMDDVANLGMQFRLFADGQLFFMTEETPILFGISLPAAFALIKLQNYKIENNDSQEPPGPDEFFGNIEPSEQLRIIFHREPPRRGFRDRRQAFANRAGQMFPSNAESRPKRVIDIPAN